MKFECALCHVSLTDAEGSLHLIGETDTEKRARYLQMAGIHMVTMHDGVISQIHELSSAMGFAVLMSHIDTDDPDLLSRRKNICEQISQMVAARVEVPLDPAAKHPVTERTIL